LSFIEISWNIFWDSKVYGSKDGSDEDLNVLLDLFSDVEVIPFTIGDAKIASTVWAKLKAEGLTINDADIMISAVCIRCGERLMTLDRDFEKVKVVCNDLQLEISNI